MRIGAKTLTSVGLLAATTAVAIYSGRLGGDHLAPLDTSVTAVAGALAVVVASAAYRFWRLWERSELYIELFFRRGFRFGTGARGRVVELPPLGHGVCYAIASLWIALLPLDNRAVAQLVDFPSKLAGSGSDRCPVPGPDQVAGDPARQGCQLVMRAYRLGYATNLGTCAPDQDEELPPVCRRRQIDEPAMHYAWRLLTGRGPSSVDSGGNSGPSFGRRLAAVDELLAAQRDSIVGAPRASHHLFTNLTDPAPSLLPRPGRCLARYARMPHLIDAGTGEAAPGRALEHVLGQLLFNPAYPAVVATCREYTVHWDAPLDACERLARDPTGFLASRDALEPVRAALERRTRAELVRTLTDLYGVAAARDSDSPDPSHIISFQCLMVEPEAGDGVVERALELDGHDLVARERRVPAIDPAPRGQIELARQLAELLAPKFGYGRLVSHESVTLDDSSTAAEALSGSEYLLTRLALLRDVDVFLGHGWIDERPDLLEVYPYHLHLENFIAVFRDHYRRRRGRL